jgi:hypothetical protein
MGSVPSYLTLFKKKLFNTMETLSIIHKADTPEDLIIFVHGFTGGHKTFFSGKEHFYRKLNVKILKHCDIAEFSYYSKVFDFKFVKSLVKMLPIIKNFIDYEYNVDPPSYADLLKMHYDNHKNDYKTINYICHSMGGIIVKLFLLRELEENGKYNGFYITLATPHRGVSGAKIGELLNNIHIVSLDPFSDLIEKASLQWDGLCENIKRKYYCAVHDRLVSEKSAAPLKDKKYLTKVEGSHTTIAKPNSENCGIVKNINKTIEFFLNKENILHENPKTLNDVLFFSYNKEYFNYYLKRPIDIQIATALERNNLWLHGNSGTGKTNSIQYYLQHNSENFFHIDLSPFSGSLGSNNIFSAIFHSLKHQFEKQNITKYEYDQSDNFLSCIANLLHFLKKKETINVYIDELSTNDENMFKEFIEGLTRIISCYQNECKDKCDIRIIITTLNKPPEILNETIRSKFYSLFIVKNISYWPEDDIINLSRTINKYIKPPIATADRYRLERAATGSPRRLKVLYRKYVEHDSADLAIQEIDAEGIL